MGLAAKRYAPKVSLGTLFMSVQFVDLLFPIFLLLGLEHVRIDPGNTAVVPFDFYDYPLTHSLLTGLLWAAAFAVVYLLIHKNRTASLILAGGVFSHWVLDFIAHRPDLPLAPGSRTYLGLGLWNSLAGTILVEFVIYAAGIWLYLRITRATDKIGKYGFWTLIGFIFVIWLANIFGEPPPDPDLIGYVGLSQWLLIAWAYWLDRHRTVSIA